ncbi:MAG: hypothetical protein FJ098_13075, partial [Deltaproteobacteria bacterium]|nr:hypothetical protein [Deltaproteobacteria bacterium]
MSAAGRKKRGNRESSASGGKDETARAGAEPGGPGGQWDPEAVFGEESTSVENLDVVGNLQAQVDALGGQLARVTAEYDNFRKRTRDER